VAAIPPFTDEHEQLRQAIREFVESELRPHAHQWEEAHWFPNDVFKWMAERGYLGLKFPPEYGGAGDPVADAVLAEELARCGSGGLAAGIGAHIGIALPPIWKFGSEEQKRRYLVAGIKGEKIAALAITEPDAGSDVASIRTRAERVEGGFVVNGAKMFITGGVRADALVTAVRTGAEGGRPDDSRQAHSGEAGRRARRRHEGLSFLIVDRGPGVESSALEKLGWNASDTAAISYHDVFVPAENLLGEENQGFYLIMANFQWERLLMALGAVGAMQVALERALERGGNGQATRHRLAEIATSVEAGRDVTYHALRAYLAGGDAVREVTIAKLATQRTAFEVMDSLLGIYGDDPELARAARDARLGPIGGGTDEIMKEILGRSFGL
jgi:acyl-CoA dehydrogenase